MIPDIFHSLSENAVAHQLKKVLLKLILCIFPKPGIQHDISLHLFTLSKLNNPVSLF